MFPIIIRDAATDFHFLKKKNIRYVLNAALGKDIYHVNTNHVMYAKEGIQFLGIEAEDMKQFHLDKYFEKAAEFIHKAYVSNGESTVKNNCSIFL